MQNPSGSGEGRDMQGMVAAMGPSSTSPPPPNSHLRLQELQNPSLQSQFDPPATPHDDFFDQMLSSLHSWPELSQGSATPKSTWDLSSSTNPLKLFNAKGRDLTAQEDDSQQSPPGGGGGEGMHYPGGFDESVLLASRLRQHQIGGGGAGLIPLPLSLGGGESPDSRALLDRAPEEEGDGVYNGFGASLQRGPAANQQPFFPQAQNFGSPAVAMGQAAPSAAAAAAGGSAVPRQRVRARRGQATDPHSIAERLRRERIAERMKALQELVPNANKTDKASMLDEIIEYVKFLQLQVKVLSMSRLGGAAAVKPLMADRSSEGGSRGGAGRGTGSNPSSAASGGGGSCGKESMNVTEHQVAKLMEEDMGSAMQYLQGKGLCLMPISLASAISTSTASNPRSNSAGSGYKTNASAALGPLLSALRSNNNADGPTASGASALTAQSGLGTANSGGGAAEKEEQHGHQSAVKEAPSASKA